MLTEQLSQLPASSTSSMVISLREDLQQILSTYRDRGSFMSSRNATLSRSTGHSSQRPTMFSSRGMHPATGPGGSSPYMTTRQAAFASASMTAPSARLSTPASTTAATAATAATGPNSLSRASSVVSAAGRHSPHSIAQYLHGPCCPVGFCSADRDCCRCRCMMYMCQPGLRLLIGLVKLCSCDVVHMHILSSLRLEWGHPACCRYRSVCSSTRS